MEGQKAAPLVGNFPTVTSAMEHQEGTSLTNTADSSHDCVVTNLVDDLRNEGRSYSGKDAHMEAFEQQKNDTEGEMPEAGTNNDEESDRLQCVDANNGSIDQGQNPTESGSGVDLKFETLQKVGFEVKIEPSDTGKTREKGSRKVTEDVTLGLSYAQDTYVDVPISDGTSVSGDILRGALERDNVSSFGSNVKERQSLIGDFNNSHKSRNFIPSDCTKSTLNSECVSETFDKSTLIAKSFGQHGSDVQCGVVNVYIVWNDDGTGEQLILKWSHPNCSDCREKYNNLKHHVHERHSVGEVKNNNVDVTLLDKVSVDLGRRSQTVVNTETLGDMNEVEPKSSLNISVPHVGKTCKKGMKRATFKKAKRAPAGASKNESKPDVKAEVLDSVKDEMDAVEINSIDVPNKRKRGRPRKVRVEPEEPSGSDHSEDGDPDYQPYEQVHEKEQVKKRPGRPRKTVTFATKKEYVCNHDGCDLVFSKLRECRNHEKEAHGEQFICEFERCRLAFKTDYQKMRHKVEKHDGLFECEHCDLTFKQNREYIAHSKTHVSYMCDYEDCGKSYATERYLKAHKVNQHMPKTHMCSVCQKAFVCKRRLNQHMKIHRERTHQCEHCPKVFKSKFAVDKHMRMHTGVGLLVCQFCGKKLNGKASLDRHERVHKGEKPYKCKYCDEAFVCQNSLNGHEQEHTGMQFVCDVCGKKCKTKGNLKEHQRTHTNERPFKCDVCGKSYGTASVLWTHKISKHLGFKRYECDVCGKQFARHHGLSKHRTVHTGVRRFECKYCHKMFTTSDIRRGHYKQVHLGIKRRGHQGKAKRLRDEAKRFAESEQLDSDEVSTAQMNDGKEAEIVQCGILPSTISHDVKVGTSHMPTIQEQMPGRRMHGLHPLMSAIDFSRERKQGIVPPSLPLDPSRSDFHTMVDSLIQFSKHH